MFLRKGVTWKLQKDALPTIFLHTWKSKCCKDPHDWGQGCNKHFQHLRKIIKLDHTYCTWPSNTDPGDMSHAPVQTEPDSVAQSSSNDLWINSYDSWIYIWIHMIPILWINSGQRWWLWQSGNGTLCRSRNDTISARMWLCQVPTGSWKTKTEHP